MKARCTVVALLILANIVAGTSLVAAYDLGGNTVSVVSWGDTLADFVEGGSHDGRLAEAEKAFNCKIVLVPSEYGKSTDIWAARLLSGDSKYDLWLTPHPFFMQGVGQGFFFPVSDVLADDYYENYPPMKQALAEAFSLKGKKYLFDWSAGELVGNLNFWWWNKTLWEREGLPNLYELIEAGEWDWDKALELSLLVTKDRDGDGQVDQWAFSIYPRTLHFTNGWDFTHQVDGKSVWTGATPEAVAAYDYLFRLRSEGVVGETAIGYSGGMQAIQSGSVAFHPFYLWDVGVVTAAEGVEWGVVPQPKAPHVDRFYYPMSNAVFMTLPANCEQPEAMIALVNFLWRPDEWDENVEKSVGYFAQDRQSARIIIEGIESWGGEVSPLRGVLDTLHTNKIWWPILNGQKTPANALSEVAAEAQALIDEALKQ